jgi:hypothetical protein
LLIEPENAIDTLPGSKNEQRVVPEAHVNWVHK